MTDTPLASPAGDSPPTRADFTRVAELHRRALKLHCYRMIGSLHEAEDAVQEAFLRAIRHFDSFRGVEGRAWILSIVRNVCYTQYRRKHSGGDPLEFDEAMHSPEEETSGPEANLANTIAAESVREGLNQLAVEFREVLVLRELEGLSYKEIAHVAGVPIGTVMSRLARGRKQLLLALRADAKENR